MSEENEQNNQSVSESSLQENIDNIALFLGYLLLLIGIVVAVFLMTYGLFHVFISTWNEATRIHSWGIFIPFVLITLLTVITILYCERNKLVVNKRSEADEDKTCNPSNVILGLTRILLSFYLLSFSLVIVFCGTVVFKLISIAIQNVGNDIYMILGWAVLFSLCILRYCLKVAGDKDDSDN